MDQIKRKREESLAEFVRRARDLRGLSQRVLCKAANKMHLSSLQRIEKGETESLMSEHALPLARALSISIYDLLGISPASPIELISIEVSTIPLLDYKEAAKLSDKKVKLSDLSAIQNIQYNGEHSIMAFAVRILDDSMSPDFLKGDIVIIDPARNAEIVPGSFVVASCSDGIAVFRQYVVRGKEANKEIYDLQPTNKAFPTLEYKRDDLKIIGIALSFVRDIKK